MLNSWYPRRFSCLLLSLSALVLFALASTPPLPRVAFVFAGSPRSFIHPPIHLSIKHNLIEGFCPSEVCESHVFVRLSLSDNSHDGVKYSARGVMVEHAAAKWREVQAALTTLGPRVNYTVVDIGSAQESDEMDAYLSSSTDKMAHKVYRDLDPRRYSMYFNRMAAYRMATACESINGFRFDWIVHARLDFFFGEPVRPLHVWSASKMWVTDQWMYDVPDVLALLPRDKFATVFYSIDTLYSDRRASCLGGPDFDNGSTGIESLRNRNFSAKEIEFAQSELCVRKFPVPGTVVLDRKNNYTWSTEGISEVLLRRKLKANGISLDRKTLGYSTFFAVMVRDPLSFVCSNSKPTNFIGWLRLRYRSNAALAAGCFGLDDDFRVLRRQHHNNYTELFGASCNLTSASTSSLVPANTPNSACLIDRQVTSWNFMPFRLQTSSTTDLFCVTFNKLDQKQSLRYFPMLQPCNETSQFEDVRAMYSVNQLFHFYPQSPRPQRITHFPYDRNVRYCFTVINANSGLEHIQLVLTKCSPDIQEEQLFWVEHSVKRVTNGGNSNSAGDVDEVTLRWKGLGGRFCIGVRYFSRKVGKISLHRCAGNSSTTAPDSRRVQSYSMQKTLIWQLDRTRSKGPTDEVPEISRNF
jgi:hypothetical protein